jgi:hypothetical protein
LRFMEASMPRSTAPALVLYRQRRGRYLFANKAILLARFQELADVPFKDLVARGCADADAALRLYGRLRSILKEKGIDNHFATVEEAAFLSGLGAPPTPCWQLTSVSETGTSNLGAVAKKLIGLNVRRYRHLSLIQPNEIGSWQLCVKDS